jgi:recombination protein RecA
MANKKLDDFISKQRKRYGDKAAYLGNQHFPLDVIPTGVMALDYALGIGGWPRGHSVEVFGMPNIGKTSVLGYSAIASAQAMGLQCGVIAVEPRFDKEWAARRGVDVENLPVLYPDYGEMAFEMLRDFCMDPDVPFDFILFDSVGAIAGEGELKPEAGSRVGGQSKLITDGVKRMLMAAWKNNIATMFINQQRDDQNARIAGLVESPGGWALKHAMMYRIHLKNGRERFTAKVDGDDRVIGKELVASIKKSAAGDSLGAAARFNFYHQEVEGNPFGVDVTSDVLNTGLKTKVIEQAGAYFRHPLFGAKKQIQGKLAVGQFLSEHPEVVTQIRGEVMEVMDIKRSKAQAAKPDLEVVNGD